MKAIGLYIIKKLPQTLIIKGPAELRISDTEYRNANAIALHQLVIVSNFHLDNLQVAALSLLCLL